MWGSCDRQIVKEEKAERRFVAEVGDGKITSGGGDTTTPDLLGKEAGDSVGIGVLVDYL